jgi:hypothetical protein
MTYDDLKNDISTYLRVEDLELHNAISTMIRSAENWLNRNLRTLDMETEQVYPLGVDGVYDLPTDWLEMRLVRGDSADLTLLYWQKIPALSDSNQTNWVLDRYPDLYLYASLRHAAALLPKDDRRVFEDWSPTSQSYLNEVKLEDWDARFSGSPLRARRWRDPELQEGIYEYLGVHQFHAKQARWCPSSHERYFTVEGRKLKILPVPAP